MRTHHRSSTAAHRRLAGITALSLASLSTAIVLPDSHYGTIGQSSVRRSLNFGPTLPATFASTSNPTAQLLSYNYLASISDNLHRDACSSITDINDLPLCTGKAIAASFLDLLHPRSDFTLVDAYVSKGLNVLHAHYVQKVNGVPVANANLNINVDLSTRSILSYGDASVAGHHNAAAEVVPKLAEAVQDKAASWKAKAAAWAGQAGQVILGGNAAADNGPQGSTLEAEAFATPPFAPFESSSSPSHIAEVPSASDDPREPLLAFLSLQSPYHDFASISSSSFVLTSSLTDNGEPSFIISQVPTVVGGDVKATRSYVHDGASNLLLAWKFEVQTNENHYEAYVNNAGETVMAIDWVRDFRPTGGEVGFAQAQMESLKKRSVAADVVDHQKKRGGVPRSERFKNGLGAALQQQERSGDAGLVDVNDRRAVKAFKEAKPAYRVFPWGVNAPDVGKRELLKGSLIELDNEASPAGWHTVPAAYKGGAEKHYTDTRGNNVLAQDNPDGGNSYEYNYRPDAGKDLLFDYHLKWPKAGTPLDPHTYINASVTELFYTNNEIHDLFYRYGFDEVSGNFQEYNFGRGGAGGDAVQANAQDGSGMNNANFATPPDGSRPRMRMYSWSGSQPYRDGDFEAGIVIHEYAHGISTRLTGGPANSGCLGWGEAGGMGEGWGDALATLIRMHSAKEKTFSMGEWASSRTGGIRYFPYSLNMTVNPSTYKTLDGSKYWGVHAIGEVWAEILFTVSELLIDEYGFSSTLFPPAANSTKVAEFYDDKYQLPVPKHGNTLAVQLIINGMKLQPCRPSFQAARDAIIEADKILTKGANECILWKGFSSRGLGPDASLVGSTPWGGGIRTDDFKVPTKCGKHKTKSVSYKKAAF